MNGLQVFSHPVFGSIRTLNQNGEPWFVAVDACKSLDIGNPTQALARLDDDEKSISLIPTEGNRGNPNLTIISEAGLYTLVLGSRKPEAKVFKRWITHDVIPTIRKFGMYATPSVIAEALSNPESIIRILTALKDEQDKRRDAEQVASILHAELVEVQPKVQFADDVAASKTCIMIREFAKLAVNAGYDMGERRMYTWLRENGYLMRDGREPYQAHVDAGLFVVEETPVLARGTTFINRVTKITGLGQVHLMRRLRASFQAAS